MGDTVTYAITVENTGNVTVTGLVLTFINGNLGAGLAFGGAFAFTRFRSAQGTSDEIVTVLIAMAAAVAFGAIA